jgi:uncharacterized protein YceK
MKHIALLLVLLSLTGCTSEVSYSDSFPAKSVQVSADIYRFHDEETGATCYIYRGAGPVGGIDCLPDSELKR